MYVRMNGDLEFTGVRSDPFVEAAIGNDIEIEDFYGNKHIFNLKKYQTDRIFVKVLEGDDKGVVLEMDLGTNSDIPSPIKQINQTDGKKIFIQKQTFGDHITDNEKNPDIIDIGILVEKSKAYYQDKLIQVVNFLSKEDTDIISKDLINRGLFTAGQVKGILEGIIHE